MSRVAINGLGRIGRATLKIIMDTPGLHLVAANDIAASDSLVYLLKYDTVYGRYEKPVAATDHGTLTIGDHSLTCCAKVIRHGYHGNRSTWTSCSSARELSGSG
jgi:glyceraldehyde-3-phosphate dehydrogenase/erythrose-4-phosphate dehydrogenase